jgi:dTDP-4-amino-4,6-dideoxygalactose transaminase
LKDFENSLKKRVELALFFQEELKNLGFEVQEEKGNVFCYLSALVPKSLENKRNQLVKKLRKYGIFCTRIWHTPIILNRDAQKEYKINLEEFPNTVEAAKRIINFPLQNYYTKEDIKKIIKGLKNSLCTIDK